MLSNIFRLILVFSFFGFQALACPGCAGSMDNPREANLVWILSGFIVLTYIPFYILYRTVFKNAHLSNEVLSDSSPSSEVESDEAK